MFYFANTHITTALTSITNKYVVDCSHTAFAIGNCLFVLMTSLYIGLCIYERKRYIAHRTISIATFFILVYLYYRLLDNHFVFWGNPPYFAWMDLLVVPYCLLLIEKGAYRSAFNKSNATCLLLKDAPICSSNEDVFGHQNTCRAMIDNFDSLDLSEGAYSVGIVGEWGQGKSSFLNLFCSVLENNAIVVRFNPRSAKDVDNIQEEFFSVLSETLSKHHTGIKRYVREYAIAVEAADEGWIGKLANIVVNLTPDQQKERINNAIEKTGKRVYVIVEDLDRLTAPEIIEVLKLIDSNGDFCNTIFMTAYDKVYVNEVLKNYLAPSVTQDYTDKYFNYEYSLPTPSKYALKTFFADALSKNVNLVENDKMSPQEMLSVWNSCAGFVVNNLRTMRHIKRFLNLFLARFPNVKNDVDMKDYIYVTLLRYTDIRTYSALCEGRLLVKGSFMNGSSRILYQSEQAKNVLKALGAKESSVEILNHLFPEKGGEGTLEDSYNRAKWADNTDRYFFDYKVASLPYHKGQLLFSENDDKKAFGLVDEYLQEGYSQALSDFLRSRTPVQVGSADGLCRLTKLIAYLDKKDRTSDLDAYLMRLMDDEEYKDYQRAGIIKDRLLFKNAVDTALLYMLDYTPLEIGFACIRMIDGLYDKQLRAANCLFTLEELVSKAEWAQKYYYQNWGKEGFSIDSAIYMSAIRVNEGSGANKYSYPARKELLSMMQLYPVEFSKMIVSQNVYDNKGKKLSLSFIPAFTKYDLFPIDDIDLKKWVEDYFTDNKIQYVLNALIEHLNGFVQVEALKDKYENGDFDGFYEALKLDADKKLDIDVETYIKKHVGFDLSMISFDMHKDKKDVRESIARLISRNVIPSSYANLKEVMELFEVGDYVALTESLFNKLADKLIYKNNIFRIEDTNLPDAPLFYKLEGLDEAVEMIDIEAIPIDGIHDRDIYYDPIIAASIIAPGQPIPVHHTDYSYYMEHFERCKYNDKSYVELIKEANCQFVHEVQHYMNEEFGGCELKVNHTLKNISKCKSNES